MSLEELIWKEGGSFFFQMLGRRTWRSEQLQGDIVIRILLYLLGLQGRLRFVHDWASPGRRFGTGWIMIMACAAALRVVLYHDSTRSRRRFVSRLFSFFCFSFATSWSSMIAVCRTVHTIASRVTRHDKQSRQQTHCFCQGFGQGLDEGNSSSSQQGSSKQYSYYKRAA